MCGLPIPEKDPLPPGMQIVINTTVDLDGRALFAAVQREALRFRRRPDDGEAAPSG